MNQCQPKFNKKIKIKPNTKYFSILYLHDSIEFGNKRDTFLSLKSIRDLQRALLCYLTK